MSPTPRQPSPDDIEVVMPHPTGPSSGSPSRDSDGPDAWREERDGWVYVGDRCDTHDVADRCPRVASAVLMDTGQLICDDHIGRVVRSRLAHSKANGVPIKTHPHRVEAGSASAPVADRGATDDELERLRANEERAREVLRSAGIEDHHGGDGESYYARPAWHMAEELVAYWNEYGGMDAYITRADRGATDTRELRRLLALAAEHLPDECPHFDEIHDALGTPEADR